MQLKHVKCYKPEYPRPQLVRENWLNLNGDWEFAFDHNNELEEKKYYKKPMPSHKIKVPFTYQTELSGINIQEPCENIWYSKNVNIKKESGKRYLLHFEGADYTAKVWVNGLSSGSHSGAYTRFSLDITNQVKNGENLIAVKCEDSFSCRQPRGKQRWRDQSYSCWYVETTGLWKTVWIEAVPDSYIEKIRYTVTETAKIIIKGSVANYRTGSKLVMVIMRGDETIYKAEHGINSEYFEIPVSLQYMTGGDPPEGRWKDNRYWENYDPFLFDVRLELITPDKRRDVVGSYFGMTSYRTEGTRISGIRHAFKLKMLLDQGYWPQSGLTPPNEDAIIQDILITKDVGCNGLRKHQKLEDERFYYYCDILGVYAWAEMPSAFIFDDKMTDNFAREYREVLEQYSSHPSVMAFVVFNESWGVEHIRKDKTQQAFADSMYYLTKSVCPDKLCIGNDGWEHVKTDILTVHNYRAWGEQLSKDLDLVEKELAGGTRSFSDKKSIFADGYQYEGQPVIISEFAGIALSKDKDKGWGYGEAMQDKEELLKRLDGLVDAIVSRTHYSGYCVTQLTDVEQEVNGLFDAERNPKADTAEFKKIFRK